MDLNLVADGLLIAVAVVWILLKQVQAGPVKPRLLVIVPVLMAYFGITTTPARTWSDSTDLLLIGLGAVISIAIGIPRGATIRVWRGEDGRWWRQGSRATLVLWGALLVARGALYGLDKASGHPAASGAGPVLLALALSFAAQNAVIAFRMRPTSAERDMPAPYTARRAPTTWRPGPSSPGVPYSGTRSPRYADAQFTGSLHERTAQRRADRRARRQARREW
ncbi:MAG: hypothetical protein ACLQVK_06025 [Acidimicrobiales bacterium]